eukprot:TRINITY_DN2304_c0_g2_i1.p1 TRINITY_DN2304_c0_g2~~TRINITY_DN2304_c0_g2_i1.p1  ORF type:complete len:1031 (-),score=168.06 TRINITY_DN2304_c0_g2_i1:368-3157(-)
MSALLLNGAMPDGLHDAVAKAEVPLIQELSKAKANPFTLDANRSTVMEIALARGDEDILTLMREFIGSLMREKNPMVKTLEENRKLEEKREEMMRNKADHQTQAMITFRTRATINLDDTATTPWYMQGFNDAQQYCKKVNRSKSFQSLMFTALMVALFIADVWILANLNDPASLDAILVVLFSCFLTEFSVQLIGYTRTYTCSFFFWMDIVGVLSVPLDHSLVTNNMPLSLDNTVVMRAARMAKLGARAGRFTKLVKLMRFLPGMDSGGAGSTAKVISATLNMALSTRVSGLIIVMVMVLPLFELTTYPENDFSMKMWADQISDLAIEEPESINEVLQLFDQFFQSTTYYPFEVDIKLNNSEVTRKLSRAGPNRPQSRLIITGTSSNSACHFNFTEPHKLDALCSILLIVTIMVCMMGASLVLSNSVARIVLKPLETLLDKVRQVAADIFKSATAMEKQENEEENDEDEVAEGGDAFGQETRLLNKVLKKIAALSAISVRKSAIDEESLKRMGDRDRAFIQDFTARIAPGQKVCSEDEFFGELEQLAVYDSIKMRLNEVDINEEAFSDWGLDILALEGPQRRVTISCIVTAAHASLTQSTSPSMDWMECASCFMSACESGYFKPEQVPYHNFAHAVDVTYTLHRVLQITCAEVYLSALERFGMLVAALAHDIGHMGVNNMFLIETAHELSLRYNDQSPLESMHCSTLFSILQDSDNDIFREMSPESLKEIRHIIVDVVLHTDFACHGAMVKNVANMYEEHIDLFAASQDMYHNQELAFPAVSELSDHFRDPDVKQILRTSMMHLADISNPVKPFNICRKWALCVLEEFFLQGDREKQLQIPVGLLNDRDTVNVPHSQMGFIEFFVSPFVFGMGRILPPIDYTATIIIENSMTWYSYWVEDVRSSASSDSIKEVKDRMDAMADKWLQPQA